jgi:DNA-binding PadR family transcriptional regulator
MKSSSTLEMALLGLLHQKPQSGYDLRKTFATTAMRHYSDSPGSIYPALRRLEGRGWIEAAGQAHTRPSEEPVNARGRQDFRISEAGKLILIAWLEAPVTYSDVQMRMSETLLRFAFMDGAVPRSIALRFLDQFARELAVYAGELRVQFEKSSSRMRINTGLLAFQSGIEGMEAQISWAKKARAQLAEDGR